MSGGKFHVHGPHDHALEHEAHGEGGDGGHKSGAGFVQWVAIFTAILATVGAIVSYQGGHAQNEALYFKNEAVLKKADAANNWAFYQAKSTKQNLAELAEALSNDAEKKAKYAADVKRYSMEKEEIKKKAEALEKQSDAADEKSKHALYPHDKLAQSMTFIQIAISLAAICVLTRRRWMLGVAGVGAVVGLVYWGWAFVPPGIPGVTH
jgi:signal transduction histidine kinase